MKTLRKGDRGEAVVILQHLLNYHGAKLETDGDFGTKTENAVRKFQKNNVDARGHSLVSDGIVGMATWQSLIESEKSPAKITKPASDPVTLKRIKEIHPALRDELKLIYDEILARGVSVRFTQVFRTFDQQDALYAKGRTAPGNIVTRARAGQSYHNYGLAVDIVLLTPGGGVSWDMNLDQDRDGTPDWSEIVYVFKHFGWKWGGDWTSFKDYPHFEKTFGLTTAELRRRYDAGDFVEGEYVRVTPSIT